MRWDVPKLRAEYQELHAAVWREVYRVLRPGGLLVLDLKDHLVLGEPQHTPEWHYAELTVIGFVRERTIQVATAGDQNTHRHRGQQRKTVDFEEVTSWTK
jgi:ubiquinone/menaquinone biosynthesis C-methylase UbiE